MPRAEPSRESGETGALVEGPASSGALVRRVVRRNAGAVGASTALLALWQACELLVPVLIGVVIDSAVATGDLGNGLLWGGVLCLHFAVLSTAYRFGARIQFRAVQTESHRLRTEVSACVLDPRGARTEQPAGDLLTVATSDADMVGEVIQQLAFTVAGAVGLVVTAATLATIDPVLAAVVAVGAPLVVGCNQLLAPALARRSQVRQGAVGRATGIATDLVVGLRPLKGIAAEDAAMKRYRRQSTDAARAAVSAARWEGVLYGVTQGLSGLFLAAVAVLAGLRALDGGIGIGELLAVVGLTQFVAEPLRMLAFLVARIAQSRASAERIVTVLRSPHLVTFGTQQGDDGPLCLVRVCHRSLTDLSLTVAPAELVAVVVEDPADAVALMQLLVGEAEPERGQVLLGGHPLTELTQQSVRARLLVADHHVDLFEGTLRSNVDPWGTVGEARLTAAMNASAADDVVSHALHGLQEPVTVGGTTLSGGQRQRLGLARALAADAEILVLRDPTSAVDTVTEHRIAAALRAARGGRSTLLLTSSPALLDQADRVVHVRAGRLVATGTHAQLSTDPAYREAVLR